jgi:hypothetical protein
MEAESSGNEGTTTSLSDDIDAHIHKLSTVTVPKSDSLESLQF